MELRQLRYYVRTVELGSMGRAAVDMNTATATVSQQISRLESELSARLLLRLPTGVRTTQAGQAFFQQAQLILRQVEAAAELAQLGRLSGAVSLGLAQTTASMLAVPLIRTMQKRYPGVRLRIVEGLSGYLSQQLSSRRLDLAILFDHQASRLWHGRHLLDERLFLIGRQDLPGMPEDNEITLSEIGQLPLVLPSDTHTLRNMVLDSLHAEGVVPVIAAEVDGLSTLLDVVGAGVGATIQPGSAIKNLVGGGIRRVAITGPEIVRPSILVGLPEEELSPASLALRSALTQLVRDLVEHGAWPGATLAPA